jgi:hypothetical protein
MKLRVREETKVPIAEQRLYWEGTLLDSNEKTLSDYDNPRNGKVLYMIVRTGDQEEDSKKMMLHIRDSMSCRIFTLDFWGPKFRKHAKAVEESIEAPSHEQRETLAGQHKEGVTIVVEVPNLP